jgi:hypothetical protein
MKPLLRHYGRFAWVALAGGMLSVIVLEGRSYGRPSGTSYSTFEVLLAFAAGVLAIACVEGDREDAQLEYLWSLPVYRQQIFLAKVLLGIGLLLALFLTHAILEGFQLFWLLDGSSQKAPYQPHFHAFRLHPLTIIFGVFPLCLWLGESTLLRGVPRRVVWPILFMIPMLGPWLLLSLLYSPILPPPPHMTFYRLPEGIEGGSLLERYNTSCVTGGLAYWAFWGTYFAAALATGVLLLKRAASNYARRLITPEETEE